MSSLSEPHNVRSGVVLDNCMSIYAAAEYSGYNPQCFRHLMRRGDIEGIKVGQVWPVKIDSLDAHLENIRKSDDRRYGPRVYQA